MKYYDPGSNQTLLLPYPRYWKSSLSLFSHRKNKQCLVFTHMFSSISQTFLQLEQNHVTHSSQWVFTTRWRQLTAGVPPLSFSSPPEVALEACERRGWCKMEEGWIPESLLGCKPC